MTTATIKDKIRGCVYGQAIGDALGLGSEFMSAEEVRQYYPGGLERYDQIIQDAHRNRWPQGAWTDDTDMMLCIARARHGYHFDLNEIAHNFKQWFNGTPLGIGRHTYNVLCMTDYEENPILCAEIIWKLYRCRSAANGGLMRTSIVGTSPEVEEHEIADICRLTHPDQRCIGSCVIITKLIQSLIFHDRELTKQEMLDIASRYDDRIAEYIELACADDPAVMTPDDEAMGYTLKTMAIAMWALWHCESFKEGLLAVVNLGGDADTNAAVACAILGAKYGFSGIPAYYSANLHNAALLDRLLSSINAD